MVALITQMKQWFNPLYWVGPIFDKELRVSSRRRRSYVLRFVYMMLLLAFVVIVWSNLRIDPSSPSAMIQSMAEAGTQVVMTIVMFQFVMMQLLAVVILSTSISDEVSHQTLGVLMTTPITSMQIVLGKLFSRIYQLLIMVMISLPIMAILRVFGGIPWQYMLASFCVTFTAMLFAGSMSLLFSVRNKQAHGVIIRTILVLGLIYGALPAILNILVQYYFDHMLQGGRAQHMVQDLARWFTLLNPWVQMGWLSTTVLQPNISGHMPTLAHWYWHCLIMLVMTVILWCLAIGVVRRVALSQAVGQLAPDKKGRWGKKKETQQRQGQIRRVRGACVVWKELRMPLIQGGKKSTWNGLGIATGTQILLYLYYSRDGLLKEEFTHSICIILFFVIGLLGSIFQSATTITTEKETRSWPILLSTPLTDWQILIGKVVGTMRRCLPVWMFLGIHMVLFTLLGYMHVAALPIMIMIVLWVIVFLSGTGLFFSMRCQKTSSAVISNLALILFLWLALPAVTGVISMFGRQYMLMNYTVLINPLAQTIVSMTPLSGWEAAHRSWDSIRFYHVHGRPNTGTFIMVLHAYAAVYLSLGVMFMAMAKRRIRKKIF